MRAGSGQNGFLLTSCPLSSLLSFHPPLSSSLAPVLSSSHLLSSCPLLFSSSPRLLFSQQRGAHTAAAPQQLAPCGATGGDDSDSWQQLPIRVQKGGDTRALGVHGRTPMGAVGLRVGAEGRHMARRSAHSEAADAARRRRRCSGAAARRRGRPAHARGSRRQWLQPAGKKRPGRLS